MSPKRAEPEPAHERLDSFAILFTYQPNKFRLLNLRVMEQVGIGQRVNLFFFAHNKLKRKTCRYEEL